MSILYLAGSLPAVTTGFSDDGETETRMDIAGNAALVTGGASGLGLATVRRLHAAGARVAILDLPSSAGKTIADELGEGAVFAPGDVTSEEDVAAAVEAAAGLGTLRIVVNCAGIGNARRTWARTARSRWTPSPR